MKPTNNISSYLLPMAFLFILIAPVLNGSLGLYEYERKDENRRFRDTLDIDLARLDNFPADAEAYFNDNFSFRAPLLDAYHHTKFNVFEISPHSDKTIVGSDGWFFKANEEQRIYQGKKDFSENQLDQFVTEWKRRKAYLDSSNIVTYWVIAPFKHYVYGEYLPFSVLKSNDRRVDQLTQRFEEELPDLIIDPLPHLQGVKNDMRLFFKQDNHWSHRAGELTMEMLLERLRIDFPEHEIEGIPAFSWQDSTFQSGIHHKVIGIAELSEVRQLPVFENPQAKKVNKYGFECIKGFPYPWDYERRYQNEHSKSGLRVLFIRDSFGEQLLPFATEVFDESVFIFDSWRYQLNEDIIEVVKPDVVIFLGLETHLEHILEKYD